MILVLELMGLAAAALIVWVLFRAARARPDEQGLRFVAWGSLIAFIIFAIWTLVDFGYVYENAGSLGQNALILALVVAVIFGYRAIVGRLRDAADKR